jgi:hypothetical protein
MMISRSDTQGAITGSTSVLGHTYNLLTPPRPWSNGAEEEGILQKLLLHFSKGRLGIILQQSFAKQCQWWSNKGGRRRRLKCVREREELPPFIGEERGSPRGVRRPLEVPSLPLHGGNPLHHVGNPLSYFPFSLHEIHNN